MMPRIAPRKSKKRKSLFLTFLLLLSIPIFVFGLLEDRNFDIRNRAFEEIEVSEKNPCVITFPNVNPYSLEVNSSFRVQVDALSTTLGIQGISIKDENGNDLFSKTYIDNMPKKVTESFIFTPTVAKSYEIKGLMLDVNQKSYECVISSSYDVGGVRVVTNNSKPFFTSSPKNSKPSQSIKTGEVYEYTLIAEDIDKDMINYSYSFTENADWLRATIVEDGGNGNLTIKFTGSTTEAASYLANVFIHDGYSKHLASQSWVISVSPAENDIPKVRIISPVEPVNISTEDKLEISWDAQDDNHIVRFELYLSSNPTNEKSWITIDKDIPYNKTSYSIDTTQLKDGTYKAIVRAIDNQKPAAIGMDVSEEIVIAKGQNDGKDPDDQVLIDQPQVINFSPTSSDELKNKKPTIKATLISSKDEKVTEESIIFKLDDKDITDQIKINKISDSEYTVIYIPQEDLAGGLHKVEITFKDTSEKEASKSWTFNIAQDDQDGDSFNIFGYYINKRVAMIIAGGIGLVVLAIFTPMIIFAVWKDDSEKKEDINPTLPPTIPRDQEEEITSDAYTTVNNIDNLVEQNFEAPEPINLPVQSEPKVEETPVEETVQQEVIQPTQPEQTVEEQSTEQVTMPVENDPQYQEPTITDPNTQDIVQLTPLQPVEEEFPVYTEAPEPEADLSQLLEQINSSSSDDKDGSKPPEPVQ